MRYYFYHCIPYHNRIHYQLQYVFSSENELIDFLHYAQRQLPSYDSNHRLTAYNNKYLDEINVTGKDTMILDKCYLRPYLFTDENGRHIDTRIYSELFKNNPAGFQIYPWIRWKALTEKYKRKMHRHRHTHFDICNNKIRHLIKDEIDPDYPEFNTKSRKTWDFESFRRISGNWKHQWKYKHQWEHNVAEKQRHTAL